jgi:hypothetical protein
MIVHRLRQWHHDDAYRRIGTDVERPDVPRQLHVCKCKGSQVGPTPIRHVVRGERHKAVLPPRL